MNCEFRPVQMDSLGLKDRIDDVLKRERMTHTDVWAGIGMTESGYYRMLKKESMDVRTLVAIAAVMRVSACELLPGYQVPAPVQQVSEPAAVYATGKRYLEERVEWLETEIRKLKTRIT